MNLYICTYIPLSAGSEGPRPASERPGPASEGPGGEGLYRRMHGQTVGWIDVQIPPVFYRTTSPPAPLGLLQQR